MSNLVPKKQALALNRAQMELTTNVMLYRAEMLKRMLGENRRDLNVECGYPETVSANDYRIMYEREGIGTKVVSVYPRESWKVTPEVYEQEDPQETQFEAAWKKLLEAHNLWAYCQNIDELSGIGHYGVLLLGLDDGGELHDPVKGVPDNERLKPLEVSNPEAAEAQDEDPADPEAKPTPIKKPIGVPPGKPPAASNKPIKPKAMPNDEEGEESGIDSLPDGESPELKPAPEWEPKVNLLYVRVLDESLCQIAEWNNDTKSPRYGKPEFYNLTLIDMNAMGQVASQPTGTTNVRVHWTRVIHVADNRMSSPVFGTPRMRSTFNRLLDCRKILGGSGEMFWKGGFPGYSFEVDPHLMAEGLVPEVDTAAIKEEAGKMFNSLQRFMVLEGMKANSLAPQVSDPTPTLEAHLKAICIAIDVPMRVFMGSEQGKLAADQDSKAWAERLKGRQRNYLTPWLIRPLVDRLILIGVLPQPKEYFVDWPDMGAPTDLDKANVANMIATALGTYVSLGIDALIPPEEFLVHVMGFEIEVVRAFLKASEERLQEQADDPEVVQPGKPPKDPLEVEQKEAEIEATKKGKMPMQVPGGMKSGTKGAKGAVPAKPKPKKGPVA